MANKYTFAPTALLTAFGSHEWFANLAPFPTNVASMTSDVWSIVNK